MNLTKYKIYIVSLALLLASAVSAKGLKEHKVSLDFKNVEISKVLNEITDQTGIGFSYMDEDLNPETKVSITSSGENLDIIINRLFIGKQLEWALNDNNTLILKKKPTSKAVKLEISGAVIDEQGIPLPGVSVVELGTENGTVTDMDGKYAFRVASDGQLEFSFVGMSKQVVKVMGDRTIDIVMKEDRVGLDEVVVVGFGTQKKENLTGAVSVVTAEQIQDRPVANVQQAIQGAAPSLYLAVGNTGGEIGSSMSMRIRGAGNISGASDPLVIVDGMPLDDVTQINDINPDDIESISVLSDAASTAIYGARAAYGVILITTKSGESTDRIVVNYSNNFNYTGALHVPAVVNGLEFANFFNTASLNEGGAQLFSDATIDKIKETMKNPSAHVAEPTDNNDWKGWFDGTANNDWWDIYYKDAALSQKHSLSFSGKAKSTRYYVSASFFDQEGLLKFGEDKFNRYTVGSRTNSDINDWLKFNTNIRYSRTNLDIPTYSRGNQYQEMFRSWPTNPLKTPYGYSEYTHILELEQGGRNITETERYYLDGSLIFTPIEGLNITAKLLYNTSVSENQRHYAKVVLKRPDETDKYKKATNSYSASFSRSTYLAPNLLAEYTKSIGDNNFKLFGGYQQEEGNSGYLYGDRTDLVTDAVPSISTAVSEVDNVDDSKGHWSTQSFFGRLNYNYKEKYLFEANLRYDGTSKFAKKDRWVLAPSYSMGYNVAKEDFWKIKEINTLKLRASYGTIGNQNVANYLYVPRLPVRSNLWWIQGGSRPVYTGMPDLISSELTWEKVTSSNIGVDFAAFSNRLTGSFDAYVRETADMTGPSETFPSVMGTSAPAANNADLETKGFEFVIKWNDKIGDVGYSATFTLANSMTKVTKYTSSDKFISKFYEGREFGEIWGFETHGIFQTNDEAANWHDQSQISTHKWEAGDIGYKDLNGDGKITRGAGTVEDSGDMKIIGNSTAQLPYSIILAADWKGLDISMFFQGIGKRDLALGGNVMYGIGGGVWHSTALKEHLDYWSEDNKGAYLPRPLLGQGWKNQQTQTKYLQDGSYLRLKNLTIGYSFPKSLLQHANLTKVRVFVSGENLWTLTNLSKSFDPEGTGSNSGVGKIYPLMRTMSFGINVNF